MMACLLLRPSVVLEDRSAWTPIPLDRLGLKRGMIIHREREIFGADQRENHRIFFGSAFLSNRLKWLRWSPLFLRHKYACLKSWASLGAPKVYWSLPKVRSSKLIVNKESISSWPIYASLVQCPFPGFLYHFNAVSCVNKSKRHGGRQFMMSGSSLT